MVSCGFQVLAVQKEAELVRLTTELEDLKRRHTQLQSKSSVLEDMTKHNAEQYSHHVRKPVEPLSHKCIPCTVPPHLMPVSALSGPRSEVFWLNECL